MIVGDMKQLKDSLIENIQPLEKTIKKVNSNKISDQNQKSKAIRKESIRNKQL